MAERTIAVRESDGFYDCCMKAVEGFTDFKDFVEKLNNHHGQHSDYVCVESYLQRLWTLQECLLSHTIQFVVGSSNTPTKRRADIRDDFSFYRSQVDTTVILDSLWFLKAYVHGGTIVKPQNLLHTEQEDLHSASFMRANLASHRYPKKKAAKMTFGEIYMDLYQQSVNAGRAFTCRFTRSMLDPEESDPIGGWLPSKHQPSPRCLGDFLKLMGHRVPEISNGNSRHVHLTTVVKVIEFGSYPDPNSVLSTLEVSMKWFRQQWQDSHQGGEISKYGNFPNPEWTLDHLDAMKGGWVCKNPQWVIRVLKDGPSLDYEEGNSLQDLYSLDEVDKEGREANPNYVSLFEQTSRILDHMWCANDPLQANLAQQSAWRVFKQQMRASWSPPLLRTMLLFAAMITCRIPLSAAGWVNRLFVPVHVVYGEALVAIGLLARTARQEESARGHPRLMFSVGQHLPAGGTQGLSFGKDIFLVDPARTVPVGILPDFLPDERIDEEFVKTTSVLYAGFSRVADGNKVDILATPLYRLHERPRPSQAADAAEGVAGS
ncbi:hypothetical protein VTG60DRAFT_4380 [Thermothelomyces hinnuleus]